MTSGKRNAGNDRVTGRPVTRRSVLGWSAAGVAAGVAGGLAPSVASASSAGRSAERSDVGANVPWTSYEAEDGKRSAQAVLQVGTSWDGTPAYEARGKKSVVLDADGEYVQWSPVVGANRITVRYNIPDGAAGPLAVYVDGVKQIDLPLTSTYMYESKPVDTAWPPMVHLFDEVSASVAIPHGATVRLQRDSDSAGPITIDYIELETAPAPLNKPDDTWVEVAGSDRAAIVDAIATADAGSKKVWLPVGTYTVDSQIDVPAGTQLRGAGIWHTTVVKNFGGAGAYLFRLFGSNDVRDMKIFDTITTLEGNEGNAAFNGSGDRNVIENVWSEHATLSLSFSNHGSTVRGCRVRNSFKDSIHFAEGSTDNLVEYNHIRNSGDDSIAFVQYNVPGMRNNVARYNTAELGHFGRGIGMIGGNGNRAHNNLLIDIVFSGIWVAVENFANRPTVENINFVVERNTIIRCGDDHQGSHHWYGQGMSLSGLVPAPMSGRVEYNHIDTPMFHGVRLGDHIGDAGTSNVVYFRYNRIGPVREGYECIINDLTPDSNVIISHNVCS